MIINTELHVQVFVTKTCHQTRIFDLILFNTPAKTLTNVLLNENRRFKVAPYSFMIARALTTKFQGSLRARGHFRYFIVSTQAKNAKLTMNFLAFPSVKFRETWQTGSKCFTLVGARFSGKSIRPVFLQR